MMNDKLLPALVLNIFIFILAMTIGLAIGKETGEQRIKQDAIRVNKAEFYFDKNFEKKWRWK